MQISSFTSRILAIIYFILAVVYIIMPIDFDGSWIGFADDFCVFMSAFCAVYASFLKKTLTAARKMLWRLAIIFAIIAALCWVAFAFTPLLYL